MQMKLAGRKELSFRKGSYIIFLLDAVEHKVFRKLGTEQIRQIFQGAESIQMLGNAHRRVLSIYHQVLDTFCTPLSFVPAGAYLLLAFNIGGKKKNGSCFEMLETSAPQKFLQFSHKVLIFCALHNNKDLLVPTNYKNEGRIARLIQYIMKE